MVAAARGASRAASVVVLLLLVAVTAACGAADPAGSPPPESTGASDAPGGPCATAVGEVDETTRSLVGLGEAEATERAEAAGLQVRLAGRGEECFALTADHRPDRVNLTLDDDGVVLAAGRG